MNVDVLQMHLSNLSHLVRDAGGKSTANELDEFVQLLQPYRDRKLKDFIGLIVNAENVLRGVPPSATRKRPSKVDPGPITARIAELYDRAAFATPEEIQLAFSELENLNLTVAQLEAIAKHVHVTEKKLKKDVLLKKMRQAVLDRKSSDDRVYT